MKKIIGTICIHLLLSVNIYASTVVCYDKDTKVVTQVIKSANTPEYSTKDNCLINPDLSNVNGTPQKFWNVSSGTVQVMLNDEQTSINQNDLVNLITQKIASINSATDGVLEKGFLFNNVLFSLTKNSEMYWTNLFIAKSMLTYPFNITALNGNPYTLSSASDVQAFYVTALVFANTKAAQTSALIQQIKACTNSDCVNSIVDNR